jgi:glycosyltransferase
MKGDPFMISVITPSLNSAEVIADCIASVGKQAGEIEHLVIDGQSTDDTLGAIERSGFPVKVVSEPASGIYSAINTGINMAGGDIIGILHADDFYTSNKVLEQVAEVFGDPATDACYGDLCYVRRAKPEQVVRYWRAGKFQPDRFLNGWMPPHPTFFIRRKIYEQLGLYRTDLGTSADYEMMVRLMYKNEIKVRYIPKTMVHMRTGGLSNTSWAARLAANRMDRRAANRMDRRAWRVNGLRPYPWTTIAKPLRKIAQWWTRPRSKT